MTLLQTLLQSLVSVCVFAMVPLQAHAALAPQAEGDSKKRSRQRRYQSFAVQGNPMPINSMPPIASFAPHLLPPLRPNLKSSHHLANLFHPAYATRLANWVGEVPLDTIRVIVYKPGQRGRVALERTSHRPPRITFGQYTSIGPGLHSAPRYLVSGSKTAFCRNWFNTPIADMAAHLSRIVGCNLNCAQVMVYNDDSRTMPWHCDAPSGKDDEYHGYELNSKIVSVTLVGSSYFQQGNLVKHKDNCESRSGKIWCDTFKLTPGDAFVFSSEDDGLCGHRPTRVVNATQLPPGCEPLPNLSGRRIALVFRRARLGHVVAASEGEGEGEQKKKEKKKRKWTK